MKTSKKREKNVNDENLQRRVLGSKYNVKFLVDIEKRTETELILLKKDDSNLLSDRKIYADKVLKIYREAFQSLIENVTTFKCILIDIKNAFETSLNVRDEIIKSNDRLLKALSADKESKNVLVEEKQQSMRRITELELELNYLKRKNEKLEKESFANYQALSIEKDARYTLLVENVKLKKENAKLSIKEIVEKPKEKDPTILQIALERCRKDLTEISERHRAFQEDFADFVPKKQYENLEIEKVDMSLKYNDLSKKHQEINEKYRHVFEDNRKLKEEVENLKDKMIDLEVSGTPRPKWDSCIEYVSGGNERWKQLTKGLSSRQTLEVVLKELGRTIDNDNMEYYDGLGFDPVVPEFLRSEGKIKKIKLTKKELHIFINDVWKMKALEKNTSMQDFLKKYLTERYEQPAIRTEWTYSFYYSCKQWLDDEQIKLFCATLNGTVSEDVYYNFRNDWNTLKRNTLEAFHLNQKIMNVVYFEKVIKTTFPMKSDVDIQNLIEASKKQLKHKMNVNEIDVEKLFTESEEGFNCMELGREIFRQRQIAQDKYAKEIIAYLGGRKNLNKLISVENIKRAFVIIDPYIDHIVMESYLRWIFSVKSSNLDMIYPITMKALIPKLYNGNIQRVGPRYRSKSGKLLKL